MSKKHLGKFVAFAAVAGAAAAGISYILRYKTYHSELEKDFREFEDGEGDDADSREQTIDPLSSNRNYIALSSSKDEFKLAARDIAHAAKHVLKDAGNLLTDTAHEAMSAAMDTAHIAFHTMKTKKSDLMEGRAGNEEKEEDIFEDEGFLDEDYVDEDALYDYSPGSIYETPSRQTYGESLSGEKAKSPSGTSGQSSSGTSTAVIEEDSF